jgi:hypothetical protein
MSRTSQNLLEGKRKSKSILNAKPIKLSKNTIGNSLKKNSITRVGETANFIVDYDCTESLILMYGKEAPTSHGFKLGLDEDEAAAIINYLKQAKTLFPH